MKTSPGARVRLAFLHRWAAVASGPVLHVMFVAGALTLFNGPLMLWEEPLAQQSLAFGSFEALLDAAAPPPGDFHLYLPARGIGRPSIAYPPPGGDSWQGFWVGAGPGQSTPRRENVAGFLYDLHFFWHHVTGGFLQNLAGFSILGFLLALASGAVLQRRRARNLGRSGRATLSLVTGALQAVYAYTGALMVLSPLLIAAAVGPVFGGDTDRALSVAGYFGEELAEEVEEDPGVAAPPLPLDRLVAAALAVHPGLRLDSFAAHGYGHANGSVDVRGSVATGPLFASRLERNTSVRLRSRDGVVLDAGARAPETATAGVARWVQGVHHTVYAGTPLRVLLGLLTVGGSVAFLVRNWLWLELGARARARHGASFWQRAPYLFGARWTAGVGAGLFVAVAALFLASRVLPLSWASRGALEELVFVAALGVCIIWAAWARDGARCCAQQLALAGLLLAPVPVLAARWSSAGLFGAGERLPGVVLVDLALGSMSVLLLVAAVALRRSAQARSVSVRHSLTPEPSSN